MKRAGWECLSMGLSGEWLHKSGWTVRHCGHPTANWPWYGVPPKYRTVANVPQGEMLLTGGIGLGIAFRRLVDVMKAVEEHAR